MPRYGDYRDRTGGLLHAMQALSRTVSKHTPTRKCGDRLSIALIRSIHQKGSQLHPASRNRATSTRHFTTQFSSVSMGFAQKEGHLREKIFSNSLLSAILILSQDLKVVAVKLGQPQYLLQISSGSPPPDLYHEHDRRL